MLAPLKNRDLIERETEEAPSTVQLGRRLARLTLDNANLRGALRQARRDQHRAALGATRRIVAQENEIQRLQALVDESRQRLAALESGQAIVELGRRLMQLSAMNDELADAAQRVWALDKTICAAHAECQRLARERDCLAGRLAAQESCREKPH